MRSKIRHLVNRILDEAVQYTLQLLEREKDHIYIIQIGANDGKTIDPIQHLVSSPKASAILVEAVPFIYNKLQQTYEGFANVHLENLVVVPSRDEDKAKFYYFEETPGYHYKEEYGWWGSTSLKYISKYTNGNPGLQAMLRIKELPCKSLNEIYEAGLFSRLDLLHTDVESLDVDLINSWNFDNCSPGIILFEHMHSNKVDYKNLVLDLINRGYTCFAHAYDTICISADNRGVAWLLSFIMRVAPIFIESNEVIFILLICYSILIDGCAIFLGVNAK